MPANQQARQVIDIIVDVLEQLGPLLLIAVTAFVLRSGLASWLMSPIRRAECLYWVGIYRQMIAVNERALQEMRQLDLTDVARDEVIGHQADLDVLGIGSRRLQARLDYWIDIAQRLEI